MLSQASVCSQVGLHITITHDALDLIDQAPATPPNHPPWTSDLGHTPLPRASDFGHTTPSGGQHWIPVHTCSPAYLPATDIWWPTLETCSKLLTIVYLRTPPPPRDRYLVVATKTRTVCKRAVYILLECISTLTKQIASKQVLTTDLGTKGTSFHFLKS